MTNPYKGATGLRRIWNACGYSLDGLVTAYRGEAAFRQLVWMAVVLIPVAVILPVTPLSRAMLIGSVLLSLIIELLNQVVHPLGDQFLRESTPAFR